MLTSAMLSELLCSLAAIGGLLLLGTFLRAKVKIFQKLFLPASVIGGFIGLLLGPVVMGENAIFKFPREYINNWTLIPGILIVPIFASVPLGMFMNGGSGQAKKKSGSALSKVLITFAIFAAVSSVQSAIGFGTNLLFSAGGNSGLYRTFGYELSQGFCGGHGTAGAVGRIMEDLGLDYWATAQGVATTTATVGIIGGMLSGIVFINIAARKGKTSVLKKAEDIPAHMATGCIRDVSAQASMGRDSFVNSSIETTSFHLALMLGACGIAYFVMNRLKATGISAFSSLPVWIYAMVIMFAVNRILIALKLDWAVDTKVKSKISGAMSDFAITCAIASLPVQAVMEYAVPIAVMCAVGFVITYLLIFVLQGALYKDDCAFERSIIAWGCATGVMITGMMLLKICDPDYETPALADFSVGFSLLSLSGLVTTPLTISFLAGGSTFENFVLSLVIACVYFLIAFGAKASEKITVKKEVKGAVKI